ncbi:hypothetical protein [Verminephrobacter eiseniae]|uniref:hypothetical protein n=1 Tax=Verminephrobacter eiseniae TaxID=364317 RepID=UPI002237B656|nr:hypothetical protein [Verminephrobacter eiseniae]
MSRHRSSVGLRWPSKPIAALHRLPIQLGMGCAMRLALRSDGCAHDPIAAASFQRPGIVCKLRQWPVSTGSDSTGQFFIGPRRPSP